MNTTDLEELILDCPILYHAASQGSWRSIRDHGLMSTSALLDRYEIQGKQRKDIEESRRPAEILISHDNLPNATIRDQLPMDDLGLRRCLPEYLNPSDWYKILNQKVFFWLSKDRLNRLLAAEAYQTKIHDVIEVDTRRLIEAYHNQIWLCPINSGYTKYVPAPRDEHTFKRIKDYPYQSWRQNRKAGDRVVELAIDYSVPDISDFVLQVSEVGAVGTRIIFSS